MSTHLQQLLAPNDTQYALLGGHATLCPVAAQKIHNGLTEFTKPFPVLLIQNNQSSKEKLPA